MPLPSQAGMPDDGPLKTRSEAPNSSSAQRTRRPVSATGRSVPPYSPFGLTLLSGPGISPFTASNALGLPCPGTRARPRLRSLTPWPLYAAFSGSTAFSLRPISRRTLRKYQPSSLRPLTPQLSPQRNCKTPPEHLALFLSLNLRRALLAHELPLVNSTCPPTLPVRTSAALHDHDFLAVHIHLHVVVYQDKPLAEHRTQPVYRPPSDERRSSLELGSVTPGSGGCLPIRDQAVGTARPAAIAPQTAGRRTKRCPGPASSRR